MENICHVWALCFMFDKFLLQGRFSEGVMNRVGELDRGPGLHSFKSLIFTIL